MCRAFFFFACVIFLNFLKKTSSPYTALCSFRTLNCMHDFWNSLFNSYMLNSLNGISASRFQILSLLPYLCCSLSLLAFSAKCLYMFNLNSMMGESNCTSGVLGPKGIFSPIHKGAWVVIDYYERLIDYYERMVIFPLLSVGGLIIPFCSLLFYYIYIYFYIYLCIVHDCSLMNGGSSQHQLLLTGLQSMGKMLQLGIIMWSSFLHFMIRSCCK